MTDYTFTVSQLNRLVSDAVHVHDKLLFDKIKSKHVSEIDTIKLEVARTKVDNYNNIEYYKGILYLDELEIPIKLTRTYASRSGSQWVIEEIP